MNPLRSLKTQFCASLILVMFALCAPAKAQQNDNDVVVIVYGMPVSIRCATQPGNPGIGDCYKVYAGTLREIPLAIQIRLGGQGQHVGIPLIAVNNHWYDFFKITVEDNPQLDVRMKLIPDTERITLAERLAKMDHRMSDDIPVLLQPKDGVSALVRIVGADDQPLPPGVYHFTGSSLPGAEEFFGFKVIMRLDFSVTIKAREAGDDNAYLEERIERYYLWGSVLRLRDKRKGRAAFEKGLALVKEYLAKGAGEEDGRFNLTPRYQAAQLCQRLGLKQEAIAHIVHAYQGANRECKWQAYHFGRNADGTTHGPMPWRAKDLMRVKLNRLRVEAKAQRSNAPVTPPKASGE